jgi:uncharacterized protein
MSFAHSLAIGVAFKPAHFRAVLADLEAVDFLEVHAENYLGAGGTPHRQLQALGEHRPLTIHGVGLSLGGASVPDEHHLQRLRHLLQRHPAQIFSEHLAWSSHGATWLPDLLPLAYDDATFNRVAAHIDAAQTALGRRLLIENPSTYLALGDPLAEADFLNALHRHTGCGLLLDINNVAVSCHNHAADPQTYLRRLNLDAVDQIHLAGHSSVVLDDGSELRVDDHGSAPSGQVMALYADVLWRSGPRPTLIEWDNDVPEWLVLSAELARTRATARCALSRREAA